jgi:hypothetical protein
MKISAEYHVFCAFHKIILKFLHTGIDGRRIRWEEKEKKILVRDIGGMIDGGIEGRIKVEEGAASRRDRIRDVGVIEEEGNYF